MDEQRTAQLFGTIVIFIFGGTLLFQRYLKILAGSWKDSVLLAATYLLVVVIVRIEVFSGRLTQSEARTLNGLVAVVFASALLAALIGQVVAARRCESQKQ